MFRGDVHWAAYTVHVSNNHRVVQCVFTIGKYFTVFTTLDSGVGFLPYSRVTSRETGLITMIDLPFLWAYLTGGTEDGCYEWKVGENREKAAA